MTDITHPAGALLDQSADTPLVDIASIAPGTVLVLAPHADDETLGCGEAIVAARAFGRHVAVALMTDGAASHPNSRTHPPAAMRALRLEEFEAAVADLDPRIETRSFAFPDAASTGDEHERARFLDVLTPFAHEVAPAVIWTTWEHDPHCDHLATARAARELGTALGVPVLSYVVWGRFGARTADGLVVRFADRRANAAKRRAAAHYRSQLTPLVADDPDGFVMPAALTEHFLSTPEIFVL